MRLRKLAALAVCLMTLTSLLPGVYAESNDNTYYHLDQSMYFTWKSATEYDKGRPDSTVTWTTSIDFKPPGEAGQYKIKEVYPYRLADERYIYPSGSPYNELPEDKKKLYSANLSTLNATKALYATHCYQYAMINRTIVGTPQYDNKTGKLSFQNSGVLISERRNQQQKASGASIDPSAETFGDLDTKLLLENYKMQGLLYIKSLMGDIPKEMESNFNNYINSKFANKNVRGYAYFAPTIIVYEKIEEEAKIISPKVNFSSNAAITMGDTITVQGNVQNRNPYAVICDYTLIADGKVIKKGSGNIGASGSRLNVSQAWKVPKYDKNGYAVKFILTASIRPQDPPSGSESLISSGKAECSRTAIPVGIAPPNPGEIPIITVD